MAGLQPEAVSRSLVAIGFRSFREGPEVHWFLRWKRHWDCFGGRALWLVVVREVQTLEGDQVLADIDDMAQEALARLGGSRGPAVCLIIYTAQNVSKSAASATRAFVVRGRALVGVGAETTTQRLRPLIGPAWGSLFWPKMAALLRFIQGEAGLREPWSWRGTFLMVGTLAAILALVYLSWPGLSRLVGAS